MRKVLFITPRDAEFGFGLAGAAQRVSGPKEAAHRILRAMDEPDIGVVAVDERLVRQVPETVLRTLERNWDGIVVVLPSPELPGAPAEDYALELIRRTIGYHLRLNP